ncbi:hypothetical protein SBA3_670016 [Candidatus Sulfopaludibacter sp. SbA3]|nr:hypothetical protein SBA3_670016 [Candidatus Sulfopaludibacter sp. SbA3]
MGRFATEREWIAEFELIAMSTYLIFSLLWGLNMIVYEVEPVQTDYLLQENIKLNLKIHNRGSQPVVVPDPSRAANSQPVYGLAGPGFPEPLMFSNFTRHDHGQPPPPLQLTTIAPGETWNGESRLNRLVTIDTPGDYRIASMLAWQEIRVRAQDQRPEFPGEPAAPGVIAHRPRSASLQSRPGPDRIPAAGDRVNGSLLHPVR